MQVNTRLPVVLAFLTTTLANGAAHAQEGFAIELFEPRPGRAILGLGTSHALLQGDFSVGVLVHYEDDPLTLVDPDDKSVVITRFVDSRLTAEALGGVGIVDWLSLGVAVPVVISQTGEDLGALGRAGEEVSGAALGDIRVIPTFTLLGGEEGLGLTLSAIVSLPTGDADAFTGDGAVRVRPTLGLDYAASGFRVGLEAGYEIRGERRASSYVSDDLVRWAVGGRMPLLRDTLGLLITLQGNIQTASGVDPRDPSKALDDSPTVSLEAIGGLQLGVADGLTIDAGAGGALVHAAGSPDVRIYLGVAWTSPSGARDSDGDGFLDRDDACSDEAEDKDGNRDEDGCPDVDDDNDGVLDTIDACRLEPEDKDGVDDADGCPDVDPDGDGVLDSDKCPTEPEDKDGFVDEDGCPDPDNDNDGVADKDDGCVNVPEDKDGFADGDGCPEPDNDNDGVADAADRCPDRPEVKNGKDDDDGCPDTLDADVQVLDSEVKVTGRINFSTNSDKFKPDSFALLDRIAKVLTENPYITKLRVEGHTDSEGLDNVNLDLSKRRAAAVAAYFTSKGVAPERLVSEGYGESRPMMKNDTPQGRAKNRRVEFRILEVNGRALPTEPAPAVP